MAAYRAMIEGRNFLLAIDGKVRRYGFYQTVFLECADQAEVEAAAIRVVKGDAELKQLAQNEQSDPPMLFLDSFNELDPTEPLPTARGRTYYVEKQWWQLWK
jgi:hypothetical protein